MTTSLKDLFLSTLTPIMIYLKEKTDHNMLNNLTVSVNVSTTIEVTVVHFIHLPQSYENKLYDIYTSTGCLRISYSLLIVVNGYFDVYQYDFYTKLSLLLSNLLNYRMKLIGLSNGNT